MDDSVPKHQKRLPVKSIRRKSLDIDQAKLDRVRHLLGAKSETEAVDQALSMLLLREELISGVTRIAGTGGVENVFEGGEVEWRSSSSE